MLLHRIAEPEPGARSRSWGLCLERAGARVQIKNQEPEISLKFRTGAGAMAI